MPDIGDFQSLVAATKIAGKIALAVVGTMAIFAGN